MSATLRRSLALAALLQTFHWFGLRPVFKTNKTPAAELMGGYFLDEVFIFVFCLVVAVVFQS
jgi:hypothetical protein